MSVKIKIDYWVKIKSETTSSAVAEAMAGQASKSSLRLGEDVPASLYYAVARKKTFGFE